MTKLTFQMTADEFYEGWKYKLKKNNYNNSYYFNYCDNSNYKKHYVFIIFVFHHSFNDISKDYE